MQRGRKLRPHKVHPLKDDLVWQEGLLFIAVGAAFVMWKYLDQGASSS
jgi:hypothetical protein